MGPGAGMGDLEKINKIFAASGIRTPDRPARSQSLFRLSCQDAAAQIALTKILKERDRRRFSLHQFHHTTTLLWCGSIVGVTLHSVDGATTAKTWLEALVV